LSKDQLIYKFGFNGGGFNWFYDFNVLIGFVVGTGCGAFSFIGKTGAFTNSIIMFLLGTIGTMVGKAFSPDLIDKSSAPPAATE
jgi:hypothetical protein